MVSTHGQDRDATNGKTPRKSLHQKFVNFANNILASVKRHGGGNMLVGHNFFAAKMAFLPLDTNHFMR